MKLANWLKVLVCMFLFSTVSLTSLTVYADGQIGISQTDVIDYDVISNNSNDNKVTSDKDYLYYWDRKTGEGIIKQSIKNPKNKRKLVEYGMIIEVVAAGGWIYYINGREGSSIYRIKPDGTSKELLAEKPSSDLYVYNDELYYNQLANKDTEDWYIQKMSMKTKKVTILKKNMPVFEIQVANDWIYFANNEGILYKMKTNGESFQKITIDIDYPYSFSFIVVSDKLYFSTPIGNLYEFNLQSGVTELIHDAEINGGPHREDKLSNPDPIHSFLINHQYIYYYLYSNKEYGKDVSEVWQMDLQSKEKKKLLTGVNKGNIYLVDDIIYMLDDDFTYYEKTITTKTPNSMPLVYADYKADQYWSGNMVWAIDKGIISGYIDSRNNKTGNLENLIKPYNPLTEAQFLTVLFRYLKPDELSTTEPIDPMNWASVPYQLAQSYNLPTNGTLTNQAAQNKPITRGKVAQIIASAHFNRQVSEKEAIQFMYSAHLSNGYPDKNGNLPKTYESYGAEKTLMRAHIVTFIKNYDLFLRTMESK